MLERIGVLLALNIEPQKRAGLLGFALERKKGGDNDKRWLEGLLHFPGVKHEPGTPVPTNEAPVQKFRWSDFAVYPGTENEYTIHSVYGTPDHLEPQGEHHILFNRAAAASQAFSRKFPSGQRRNILIHTKLIIVDFTSDAPLVISGSHNFSRAASHDNDENFLIIRDNIEVADAYGCELMRLYDHYRFRFKTTTHSPGEKGRPLTLDTDDR